ncbi:MAG: carboxypeptidase-like regulatory domain-containing protein [Anaerolineales bacterium]
MNTKKTFAIFCLLIGGIAISLIIQQISAYAQTQPKVSHNSCVGNCVADSFFLRSAKSDSIARAEYHRWYDTYYTLTDCNDSWKSKFSFLLDVIGEIVGAPGAPTLQCWQGVLGVANACDQACKEYFIPDAKYAPNIKVRLASAGQGHAEVIVDNHSNLGQLAEREPNAYTRNFRLMTYLQYEQGMPLLVQQDEIASLSFPNWISRGGYSSCITEFGVEEDRCKILSAFLIPDETTTTVNFGNGALYDLTTQIKDMSDADGSFSRDGYIRLLSDGDSITIEQGDFSGIAWIKIHNKSKDTHYQQVIPWDAHNGSVTITNHECNTIFSTCWIFGNRTEADTYVFALHGPDDKMLQGSYQVEVVAEIEHDKNLADNRVTYTYDAVPEGGQTSGGESDGQGESQNLRITDLPIVNLPGAGIYDEQIPDNLPGMMFRLTVPVELQKLIVSVVPKSNHQFEAFVRYGEIPVPNYPTINNDYDCWMKAQPEFYDICPYGNPPAGEVFILVKGIPESTYQLKIEWTFRTTTPTTTFHETPTPQSTSVTTEQSTHLSEVEDNGQRASANAWDQQLPFTGRLTIHDMDYLKISIPQSGIYTFTLSPLSPDLQIALRLHRFESGSIIYTERAPQKGESVTLTFGALEGEQYYISIYAANLSNNTAASNYQITRTQFIPDPDEPNDSRSEAVQWDLREPYNGYLIRTGEDRDYLKVHFPQSGIFTIWLEDLDRTQNFSLRLVSPTGSTILSSKAKFKGESINLTFDASAGEEFFLVVSGEYSYGALNPYQIRVAEMIPDPHEPNDDRQNATLWDISQGSIQGYLWDGIRGGSDYFKFTAPITRDQTPVTFTVSNPSAEMILSLSLLNARGSTLKTVTSPKGQPVELGSLLEANKTYYLRISSTNNKKSLTPYSLAIIYTPAESESDIQEIKTITVSIQTFSRGLIPLPMQGVEVYAQVDDKPEIFLGKTNRLGMLSNVLSGFNGQEIMLRPHKPNVMFSPLQASWIIDDTSQTHRWVFFGSESPVIHTTPQITATPVPLKTSSPQPGQNTIRTPSPSTTFMPTLTQTEPAPTATLKQGRIYGYLWRLFPNSEPAGVGAGEILLTINGKDQPVAMSMIDGSYTILIPNLQAGDILRLSARGAEDRFEPEVYEWQVENGVTEWNYDFYSYWGTITPPARDDQNRISGRVIDLQGRGVAGVFIIVQMGNSDALQRIGPTDANGYYEGYVRLPSRIMVTVWVEQAGYVPSRQQFFHAFTAENRVLNFIQTKDK